MLDDFLHRFKTLADTLMSHPRVRVTHLWIGPPATDEALAELALAWEHPIPAALGVLYRQANGMQLRWVDIGDEMYDPSRDDPMHFDGPWRRLFEERGAEAGLLDVPTIDELMGRDTVGAMADLDDEEYAYLDRAIPFDSFGESQDAVLFFGDGADDPWVSVASDNLADVDPPGELTLSQYLRHVLTTWASTEGRMADGPGSLDRLLRERIELDPAQLVGQRVMYKDGCRGGSLMRGRVLSVVNLAEPPRDWWFGPTVVEVGDDLGETLYVPLRALFPPDDADGYERLRADPQALSALLRGPADPMFDLLASVSRMTHGGGLPDGPTISNHAWAHAALTSKLPPPDAAGALLVAAQTLFDHPDVHTKRPIVWPKTRPPGHGRATVTLDTLAVGLFDAAILHIGRVGPAQLADWLGLETAARLPRLLRTFQTRNRLRGYNPLTDPSRTCGFLFSALRGGPTALNTSARCPKRGGQIGLADLRVVGV